MKENKEPKVAEMPEITKEELANLKQVAKYWGAGRIVFTDQAKRCSHRP